jgi:putative transposase
MQPATNRTKSSITQTMHPVVAPVLRRRQHPLDVVLTCLCWYAAYPLSLHHESVLFGGVAR